MDVKKVFQENVRSLMEAENLTQQKLADEMRCSASYIRQYISGSRTPGLGVIATFAKGLKVSPDRLISDPSDTQEAQYYPGLTSCTVNEFLQLVEEFGGFNRLYSHLNIMVQEKKKAEEEFNVLMTEATLEAVKREIDKRKKRMGAPLDSGETAQ